MDGFPQISKGKIMSSTNAVIQFFNRKQSLFVSVVTILLFTIGCTLSKEPIDDFDTNVDRALNNIYIVGRTKNTIEIWEMALTNEQTWTSARLYGLPLYSPTSILPPIEQALLSDCSGDINKDICKLPDIPVERGIVSLKTSPSKDFLAWQENLFGCVLPTCYGSQTFSILSLAKDDKKTVLEMPLHADKYNIQSMDELSWSTNSRFLAYIRKFEGNSLGQLNIIDVIEGESVSSEENVYKYAWSPHNSSIAYIGWEYLNNERSAFVKIVSLDNQPSRSFYNNWVDIQSVTWSPLGKEIAVIAQTDQDAQDEIWRLYVIGLNEDTISDMSSLAGSGYSTVVWDAKTNRINLTAYDKKVIRIVNLESGVVFDSQELPEEFVGLNPVWSPNGHVIAVNFYPSKDRLISDGIIFINAEDGAIIARLDLPGIGENWFWDASSTKIILNLQNKSIPCIDSKMRGIGSFELSTEELQSVVFNQQLMNSITNCEIIITEIAR